MIDRYPNVCQNWFPTSLPYHHQPVLLKQARLCPELPLTWCFLCLFVFFALFCVNKLLHVNISEIFKPAYLAPTTNQSHWITLFLNSEAHNLYLHNLMHSVAAMCIGWLHNTLLSGFTGSSNKVTSMCIDTPIWGLQRALALFTLGFKMVSVHKWTAETYSHLHLFLSCVSKVSSWPAMFRFQYCLCHFQSEVLMFSYVNDINLDT